MFLTALKVQLASLAVIAGLDTAELPGLSPEMRTILDDLAADQGGAENKLPLRIAWERATPLANAGDKDASYALARWSLMTAAAPDIGAIVKHYRAAAAKGHVSAKCELAQVLLQAFPQDNTHLTEAIELLREAQTAKHPVARRLFAHLLITGAAAPVLYADAALGRTILEKASSEGDADATLDLSTLYGAGIPEFSGEPPKSLELLITAANQGSTAAMNAYAARLLLGDQPPSDPKSATTPLLVKQDPAEALNLLKRSAAKGSVTAHRFLGALHDRGLGGLPKDPEKAVQHYQTAANHGDPQSQFRLAQWFESGLRAGDRTLVGKHIGAALSHYEVALEGGLAEAAFEVANHYDTGRVVGEDPFKAFTYFLRAAAAGVVEAQHRVGKMYRDGRGTHQDFMAAMAWLQRAADENHVPSQLELGILMETGAGGSPEPWMAALFYSAAAEQGSAPAMLHLARFYERGLATGHGRPDLTRALAYADLAVEYSNHAQDSLTYRDQIKARMTAEQIAEAKMMRESKKQAMLTALPAPVRIRVHGWGTHDPPGWWTDSICWSLAGWDSPFTGGRRFHHFPRLRLIATPADGQAAGPPIGFALKRWLFDGPAPIADLLQLLEKARFR